MRIILRKYLICRIYLKLFLIIKCVKSSCAKLCWWNCTTWEDYIYADDVSYICVKLIQSRMNQKRERDAVWKGGKKKKKIREKKNNFEVHPTNTAAKLTGKQDRSTARVGGFNPELVRLRRRSAPVSLVRTLRLLPSRSLSIFISPSLSLSSLPNLSFAPLLSLSLSLFLSPPATFVDASPSISVRHSRSYFPVLFCLSFSILCGYCS